MKCGKCGAPEGAGQKCPKCGTYYQAQNTNGKAAGEGDWAERLAKKHPVLSLGLIIATVAIAWSVLKSPSQPENPTAALERQAFSSCRNHVRSQLTRPSTMRVSVMRSQTITRPDGNFVVQLAFSEENVLGVQIDQMANCSVDQDGRVLGMNVNYR